MAAAMRQEAHIAGQKVGEGRRKGNSAAREGPQERSRRFLLVFFGVFLGKRLGLLGLVHVGFWDEGCFVVCVLGDVRVPNLMRGVGGNMCV